MTKLALIPPTSLANEYVGDGKGYYLYLPQLMGTDLYDRYVWRTTTKLGWTILDNGAFEGVEVTSGAIMDLARELSVDELVVPDVLRDHGETIKKVGAFDAVTRNRRWLDGPGCYMGVAQGTTLGEVYNCVRDLAGFDFITTIGLPKHLCRTINPRARLILTRRIYETFGDRFQIHYLGSSPLFPAEIAVAAEYGPVRSMDTSMPFVYAYYGKKISIGGDLERPAEYFRLPKKDFDLDLVAYNVITLQAWAE